MLHLQDFGVGLLAGLTLKGVKTLDDFDLPKFHQAFEGAYHVIEEGLDQSKIRFILILDRLHGTSPHVDEIMNWWLRFWATKDSPGTTWRFNMGGNTARHIIQKQVPGGEALWLKAADAFLESYRSA